MKKALLPLLLCTVFLLSACGSAAGEPTPAAGDGTITIVATTYPVYLFTTAVTQGAEGVEVLRLVNQETACLHDYTLTVTDMKTIEKADVIVMNGAGLEDFMAAALETSDAVVIDCSQGVDLLPAQGHEGHDHETEYDPHLWMDPGIAGEMMGQIAAELTELTGTEFHDGLTAAREKLAAACEDWAGMAEGLSGQKLITFHDGFQYFAGYFALDLLKSIEEEEGAETSAAEIREIVGLVEEHRIGAIFTERNGSDATAKAIARETGCAVYPLDMMMSGDGAGIQPYIDAMEANLSTIVEALG